MTEIENYNCLDLCMQKTCDKHITRFLNMNYLGMDLFLTFCDHHYEEFCEKYYQSKFIGVEL